MRNLIDSRRSLSWKNQGGNDKTAESLLSLSWRRQGRNDNLHSQFVQLGRERNRVTYKLLALLPQIYKEGIYRQKGYPTIYEYAGKLAGLSHCVVEKALNLDKHLENKPFLQKAIETQGVHKVALVAKLATPETDKAFADKVENMSKSAIQTLSKELRQEAKISAEKIQVIGENLSFNVNNNSEPNIRKCHAAPQKLTIELDPEMQFLFLKLKEKLGKNLSNKEALRKILIVCENQMSSSKPINKKAKSTPKKSNHNINSKNVQNFPGEKMGKQKEICGNNSEQDRTEKANVQNGQNSGNPIPQKTCTRNIPVHIKREVLAETQGMCSYPGCNNPAQIFHHTNRFSESKNHNSLITLCKIHHEFAHNGMIRNENTEPKNWQLQISDKQPLFSDELYRKYRKLSESGNKVDGHVIIAQK